MRKNKTMSQIGKCQNCLFSYARPQSIECRRNAPAARFPGTANFERNFEEQQRTFWPRVYELDWCGEYAPKNKL